MRFYMLLKIILFWQLSKINILSYQNKVLKNDNMDGLMGVLSQISLKWLLTVNVTLDSIPLSRDIRGSLYHKVLDNAEACVVGGRR